MPAPTDVLLGGGTIDNPQPQPDGGITGGSGGTPQPKPTLKLGSGDGFSGGGSLGGSIGTGDPCKDSNWFRAVKNGQSIWETGGSNWGIKKVVSKGGPPQDPQAYVKAQDNYGMSVMTRDYSFMQRILAGDLGPLENWSFYPTGVNGPADLLNLPDNLVARENIPGLHANIGPVDSMPYDDVMNLLSQLSWGNPCGAGDI